jgi:membrane associated rhomboid family serine protease
MFKSIGDDIRQVFSHGNMLNKLMIVNIAVFVVIILCKAFLTNIGYYQFVFEFVALPGNPMNLLYKPWTLITHMFTHEGFWHLLWNMVGLMLFGRIVGDLIGDRKVLPIYIIGGLAGALWYIIYYLVAIRIGYATAVGASAAVMALAASAAYVAPDYGVRLILLGEVRLKYIVLAFILFDLVGTSGANAGGSIAHLGGVAMGALIVYGMKTGYDVTDTFNNFIDWFSFKGTDTLRQRSKMKVSHRSRKMSIDDFKSSKLSKEEASKVRSDSKYYEETKLDMILEKIKEKGYDKLSKEEKDFLNDASKR